MGKKFHLQAHGALTPGNNGMVFAMATSILFFLLSCILVNRHELWIDEAYHYLLSRNSNSPVELYRFGTVSGHPVLWNIILFFLFKITSSILSMQLFHCFAAAVCVFLILRYSPFSRTENLLIVFGYYFFYEYNIIAKNYMPGFLLLFLAVILSESGRSFLFTTIALGLAANMHLFTMFVSVSLFIYLYKTHPGIPKRSALIVFILFCVVSLIQVIPPLSIINSYHAYDEVSYFTLTRLKRALASVCLGLINIPDLRNYNFWNSSIIYNSSRVLTYLLSAGLLFSLWSQLRQYKNLFLLFILPLSGVMMFVYLAPLTTGVRYWGYTYLMLIICMWFLKRNAIPSKFTSGLFMCILVIQFLVSVPVVVKDYLLPFSNSKAAAQALKDAGATGHPLFVEILALGPPISAYSGKPIYYTASKTWESFSYQVKHTKYLPGDFVKESISDLHKMKLDTCILVMRQSIPETTRDTFAKECTITRIKALTGAIIPSENYYLYKMSLRPQLGSLRGDDPVKK